MEPFQQALDHVLVHLRQPASGNLRASRPILSRLAERRAVHPGMDVSSPVHPVTIRETPPVRPAVIPPAAPHPCDSDSWEDLRARVAACVACPQLASSRSQTVFGIGDPQAELLFVGEAPGSDEDLAGEPFVGKAGMLLTKIIEAMGLTRDKVFIANVLKCRPDTPAGASGNRQPTPDEMFTCLPYLRRQIQLINPKVIVALGGVAMRGLFGEERAMRELRGRWHDFSGTPVMATYHPAYLLRNSGLTEKRKVWEDMLKVLEKLDHPINERQRKFFLPKS